MSAALLGPKGRYLCPIPTCAETWEMPIAAPLVPSAFADIFGTTPTGMAEGWNHTAMQRVEGDIERHLRTHGPLDWLPELMRLKNVEANAIAALGKLMNP